MREPSHVRCLLGAVLLTVVAASAAADPIPPGGRGENIEAIGYTDAAGASPFKMTLLQNGDQWLMYTSNFFHRGWAIFDVTDPTDPRMLKFIDGPANTSTWQIDIADGLMITSLDGLSRGWASHFIARVPTSEGMVWLTSSLI